MRASPDLTGHRLVDGVELIAHLVHPDHFAWTGPSDAYRLIAEMCASASRSASGDVWTE
jgi:hypothetical protein